MNSSLPSRFRQYRFAPLLVALSLPGFLRAAEATAAAPFADGEIVALVGDSITHGGRWHRYIADFYATRFPNRTVRFVNGGISGDTAGGVLARVEADILVHHPTSAIVMLGMNDVGRDSYKPGLDNDAKAVAQRTRALASYEANLTKLVDRLRAGGVSHVTLVTPSPFDQTASLPKENLPGVNDALGKCGAFVSELAPRAKAGLIDFHGPMTALNRLRQDRDPAFTLIGADRVHPGPPGHLIMAWLFLKAQHVPAWVSRVELDAPSRNVRSTHAANLAALSWHTDGLTFSLTEESLPWPIEAEAAQALDWAPILRDLNRQELVVTGLASGKYQLNIDDTPIGTWPAESFAEGVNLAAISTTPMARQAQQVMKLSEERRNIQVSLRSIAYVELKWFKSGTVNLDDATAVSAALDAHVAKGGATAAYYATVAASYRKAKPEAQQLWRQIEDLTARIREAARPIRHHYQLRRAGD